MINPNSSPNEIKKAYHKLAKIYHPDKSKEDSDKFRLILEAYNTLSDPISKKEYDQNNLKTKIKNDNICDDTHITFLKKMVNNLHNEEYIDEMFKNMYNNLLSNIISLNKDISLEINQKKKNHYENQKINIKRIKKKIYYEPKLDNQLSGIFIDQISIKINKKLFKICINTLKSEQVIVINDSDQSLNYEYEIQVIRQYKGAKNIFFINKNKLIYNLNMKLLPYVNGFNFNLNLYDVNLKLFFEKPYLHNNYSYKIVNKNIEIIFIIKLNVPTSDDIDNFFYLEDGCKANEGYTKVSYYNIS